MISILLEQVQRKAVSAPTVAAGGIGAAALLGSRDKKGVETPTKYVPTTPGETPTKPDTTPKLKDDQDSDIGQRAKDIYRGIKERFKKRAEAEMKQKPIVRAKDPEFRHSPGAPSHEEQIHNLKVGLGKAGRFIKKTVTGDED